MRTAALVAAFSLLCLPVSADVNEPPTGFRTLFNGTDLSGWFGMQHVSPRKLLEMSPEDFAAMREKSLADVNEHWGVENGELVNDGHGLYLTTEEFFGDIELRVDYKTVAKADSGIYLRATPQVQIWDTTEEGGKWKIGADKGSGGLWNNSAGAPGKDPAVLADKPFGEWNRFRIIQCGARTWIWLNGKKVVDGATMENWHKGADRKALEEKDPEGLFALNKTIPLAARGPIQLQTHGGEIRWRNVFVREIPSHEANTRLQAIDDDSEYTWVFNGKDLSGWTGAVNNYQVQNGAILCKKGAGGNLLVDKVYTDFVARLEFLLPPHGNNGLAIRFPTRDGKGDTAYAGNCELQVLDNPHPGYHDKLDPRQYHGSAYGMVAAHRGYLRPTGEWNYQQVTVKGSTLRVELNGSVILDTDLSQVEKFMGNKVRGKDNTSGYFGFAGHGSTVQFRNVRIKELE